MAPLAGARLSEAGSGRREAGGGGERREARGEVEARSWVAEAAACVIDALRYVYPICQHYVFLPSTCGGRGFAHRLTLKMGEDGDAQNSRSAGDISMVHNAAAVSLRGSSMQFGACGRLRVRCLWYRLLPAVRSGTTDKSRGGQSARRYGPCSVY